MKKITPASASIVLSLLHLCHGGGPAGKYPNVSVSTFQVLLEEQDRTGNTKAIFAICNFALLRVCLFDFARVTGFRLTIALAIDFILLYSILYSQSTCAHDGNLHIQTPYSNINKH